MARARLKRDRLEAVAATGPAAFTGAVSALLDAGTLLQRDDQVLFRVRATVANSVAQPATFSDSSSGTQTGSVIDTRLSNSNHGCWKPYRARIAWPAGDST
ncbi:hypothetical protein D3C73_1238570 [compost metagenome]